MLNLYKNYKKNSNDIVLKNNINNATTKNFPASTREWDNSIYTFNKNYLKLIPEVSKLTMKLIKSYFDSYNNNLENKLRKSNIKLRFRRLSSNKIYVSNGIFKHTNNNVIITLYVYNRQKINYTHLLDRKFKKFLIVKLTNNLLIFKNKINNIENNKSIVFELFKNENTTLYNNYKSLYESYYNIKFYEKLMKKVFRKYRKYFLYKQLLYINNSKFNYNYLSYLSSLLKKVYNKNVQFNIVNLKYFYLNSDIFTESILLKIRRDRRKLIRKLKILIIKSKINNISKLITNKSIVKNTTNTNNNDPITNIILKNSYKNKKTIKRTVLSLIKFKRVTGVRLEAKGRLTKRYTASRSLHKLRYKGNLVDIDSSYMGISTKYLRGNLRSNVQYTQLKSKTRIGSFGLKGWISGY
jgi:hypothetical protein